MVRTYKLLIFDWDGTLMDSAACIIDCMQQAFTQLNLAVPSDVAVRNIIGLGSAEAITQLGVKDEATIERIVQAYRQIYVNLPSESRLFTGAQAVLEALQAEGYYLAIATGKSRRGLERELTRLGLQTFFPITRCADETLSKPNPLMLDEILSDYNLAAHEALMIGDSEYDLQMANNKQMAALAVSYGAHELKHLLTFNPVGYIDDIRELPVWLQQGQQ